MDERRELARRMREMAVNTGALNCLGCGYEHSCGVHGCAVLKRAAGLLAPAVDITTPITLEELREAAAERPVLVYVICVDEDGQLEPTEYGEWEMFFDDDFIADGTFDTACNYGHDFVAFWDEPGRDDRTMTGGGHGG